MSQSIIRCNTKELFCLHVCCSLTDKTLPQSCPAGLCWGISARLPSGTRAWPFCFETAEVMERWGKERMKWCKWRMEGGGGGLCYCGHLLPIQFTPCTKQVYTAVFQRHASWSLLLENLLTSPHNWWHHTAVSSSASGNMTGLKRCHYSGDIIRLLEFFSSLSFLKINMKHKIWGRNPSLLFQHDLKKRLHGNAYVWKDILGKIWEADHNSFTCPDAITVIYFCPFWLYMGSWGESQMFFYGSTWHWVSLSAEHLLFGCISLLTWKIIC